MKHPLHNFLALLVVTIAVAFGLPLLLMVLGVEASGVQMAFIPALIGALGSIGGAAASAPPATGMADNSGTTGTGGDGWTVVHGNDNKTTATTDKASSSGIPAWLLPVGIGAVGLFVLMAGGMFLLLLWPRKTKKR